jgi:glucan biosynthesis protein C
MANQSNRIYFLDNLRAFVTILVIVLHGSMSYMAYAPDWWYVLDSQNSLFFTYLVLLIDVPIMPILFFIAGYFALPSLLRRGPGQYIKDKFIRIGAPWMVGTLVLAPLIAYMAYFSRHVPMTLLQFWTFFWTVRYEQSVYWFLGVLLFLFVLLVLACGVSERLRTAKRQVLMPTLKLLVSFGAILSLAMFAINQFFPADAWYTRLYILVFQPLRFPLYVGYFGLGIYAHLSGWFSAEGYKPDLPRWALVWSTSGAFYLGNRSSEMLVSPVAYAILFNVFCLSSLLAGAALFQKLDKSSPVWNSLSANSYGIYYIHPLILYPLVYSLVPMSLPLFVKAPLVMLSSTCVSWAVSALVLTQVPILRRVFAQLD